MSQTIKIADFTGGLSTDEPSNIADNQLAIASNVSYDSKGILGTRLGISDFGTEIPNVTGQHSIYFTRFADGTRILLVGAGTKVYRYNEGTTVFDEIQTGLTDGLPLSFFTYKDVIYWGNGTDKFTGYDGTTVTTYTDSIKAKWYIVQNDVIYAAGVATDPSSLFYINANSTDVPGDFEAANVNIEPVNQDEGLITGLSSLGPLIIVGKSILGGKRGGAGAYQINVFASPVSIEPGDFDGDVASHRSFTKVENDLIFGSENGGYSMAQRRRTTGSFRTYAWTMPIQKIINGIEDKSTMVGYYSKRTNNMYMAVNYGGGSQNDTLLVYSVKVSNPAQAKYAWTTYDNINANDFTEYIDADGESHILIANAFGGQVVEIETGFSDNGVEIGWRMRTKTFDFGSPELWKTIPHVDAGGFISQQEDANFILDMDGVESSKSFTGEFFAIGDDADYQPLGTEPLGEDSLGGGPISEDGLQYFPFLQRRPYYVSGQRLTVEFSGNSSNSGFKLTKLNVPLIAHDPDTFPINNITV